MRKILTFLAVIVVCAGCKNYQADIDNYLSYWSTQATIARYSFDPAAVQIDSEKIQNIPSSSDVNVILTVRNPKNFTFKMPQDPGAPTDIVVFPTDVTGTAGGAPAQPTDYTLTQDSSSQLRLTYKKEFLQKYESVKKNIGPTIRLYAADSRPFPGTFKLNVKVNTPPPNLTYWAIGKTTTAGGNGKQYYVLFLEANGMDTTINDSNLLHKDIRYLSIAEGSGTYTSIPLTVKADKSGFDISGADGRLLAHTETAQLALSDVESEVPPDILPASTKKWILCVKTNVEVKSPKKEYRFLLQDEAGLRSTVALHAFTSANDKLNRTNTQEISSGQDAWKKLKAAVAAAKDGDVIIIDSTITATNAEGNSGAIEITKKITIKGKNGAGTDMLDANSYHPDSDAPTTPHRIFTIKSGGNLTLENLTLKNGKAEGSGEDRNGGAIWIGSDGTVTMTGCMVQQCTADFSGGGIESKGTLTINGGIIGSDTAGYGNHAEKMGGGIFLDTGKCTFNGVTVQGNTINTSSSISKGNGVYLNKPATGSATLTVTGVTKIGSSTDINTLCLAIRSSSTPSAFVMAKDLASGSFINIEPQNYYSQKDKTLVKVPNGSSAAAYNTYFHLTSIPSGETYILNPNSADEELLLKEATVIGSTEQNPWKKLKAAVAAAKDGDVISIDGTITATSDSDNNGEIAVTKSITIRGKSGAGTDILNANGTNGSKPAHRIFKVTDCDLTLEGLTLKGGMATGTELGGGIYITTTASNNSTLTLKNGVRISANSAQKGGGIAVENAKLIIEAGCAIGGEQLYTGSDASKPKGNWTTSSGCGGGIYVGKKAECTIKEGVKIQYNSADSGGGIYVDSSDSATDPDKGELIVNGTAANPVVISNCVVTGSSSSGGGIYSKGKVTLEYAKLEHNEARTNGQGGGIYINEYAGACALNNTKITECEAASAGGGVYIFANRSLTLKGSTTITPSSDVEKGKNDVFLTHYAYISISGILSASQVARISMAENSYNAYTNNPVLQGDIQGGASQNYSKFTVTPLEEGGSTLLWQINAAGKLERAP